MNQKQYVKNIIQRSCLPKKECKRLEKDLEHEINAALERGESMEQIMKRMGDPDDVAAELYENYSNLSTRPFREYQSEKILFGLPLVHIIQPNYTSSEQKAGEIGRSFRLPTARGIFAFGPKALGFFSVGYLSAGLISIGFLSAGIISLGLLAGGLFSIGNFALALFFSLGNMAIGLLSAGNMALGYAAAGNLAVGKYAIGNRVDGTFTFIISDLSRQIEQIKLFFAGLAAPAPVRTFFGIIENALEAFLDPITALPFIIISSIILIIIITLSCTIPKNLLDRNK